MSCRTSGYAKVKRNWRKRSLHHREVLLRANAGGRSEPWQPGAESWHGNDFDVSRNRNRTGDVYLCAVGAEEVAGAGEEAEVEAATLNEGLSCA